MPRAKIPYEELEIKLGEMYPYPIYRRPRLRLKGEYQGFTPVTVYDRSKGNFGVIGYRVMAEFTRFQGTYDNAMNPEFRTEMKQVVLLLD